MARVMRTYHQRWRYRHPTSQDFFDAASEVAGQDLTWFFDQFFRGTQTLDYEIAELESDRQTKKPGEAPPRYENEIAVRRLGEAWFPIEIDFRFEDGGRVTARPVGVPVDGKEGVVEYRMTDEKEGGVWIETWPIRERWKRFRFASSAEVTAVALDPDRKLLIEANWTNNSRTDATGLSAGLRWSTGAMFWLQALLQLLA